MLKKSVSLFIAGSDKVPGTRSKSLISVTGGVLIIFTWIFLIFSQPAAADLYVSAESAVLIEPITGEVLYEKNKDERRSMASTTKIMTALITLESGRLEEEITVTDHMVRVEGTSMGLRVGDKVTLKALVYGMMLPSGNDAANTAAVVLGGSIEGFAKLMNERAKKIGMTNSHFVTPSGLDDDEHYSTAYDMALLAAEAMKNPLFKEIVSSKKATVEFGNPSGKRTLYNHNRLLKQYEGAIGIKTGFTKKSGRCLVSAAERDGVGLVAVTLKAPDDWSDHETMLDSGFSNLTLTELEANETSAIPVVGGKQKSVSVGTQSVSIPLLQGDDSNIRCKTQLEKFLYAPVDKGEIIGVHTFYYDDKVIASVPIITTSVVEAQDPVETTMLENIVQNLILVYNLTFE